MADWDDWFEQMLDERIQQKQAAERDRSAVLQEKFLRKLWGKERDGLKRCVHCKREKDVSKFSRKKTARDGLQSHCKRCAATYHQGRIRAAVRDSLRGLIPTAEIDLRTMTE
jgi:CRISPR/Cas system-associated protein Cas10 (large subunit of type III CRISPR-Cas system)